MSDEIVARARAAERKEAHGVDRERAYEPGRLSRGAVRGVERMGPNQWRVEGRHEKYYDVNLDLDTPCDCMDAQMRGRPCLHELSARLHSGESGLIQALGNMLLARQRASGDEEDVEDEAQHGRHGDPC